MHTLSFDHPENVFFALSIPLYLLILLLSEYGSWRALRGIASLTMLPKLIAAPRFNEIIIRLALTICILLTATILLMRPRWGSYTVETLERHADIVLALDISSSMLARDIYPSRLEKAKIELIHFTQKLQGERVGLVLFSGTAFGYVPLTYDYQTLIDLIHDIDSDMISYAGTDLSSALTTSLEMLETGSPSNKKGVVLLSDGEDHRETFHAPIRELNDKGIQVHVIALGNKQGDWIPLPTRSTAKLDSALLQNSLGSLPGEEELVLDAEALANKSGDKNKDPLDLSQQTYLHDAKGRVVVTQLNLATLKEIAFQTGGRLLHSTSHQLVSPALYEPLGTANIESENKETIIVQGDKYIYPTILLLILLLGELAFSRLPRQK